MVGGVRVLTEATFDEELGRSALPVLVEFWADWCPPCKILAPVLDSVAVEHGDLWGPETHPGTLTWGFALS